MKNERNFRYLNSRCLSKTMYEKLVTRKWYIENINQWSWKKWKNSSYVKIWTSNFEHKIAFSRCYFFHHSIILSFILGLNINCLSWTSKTLINLIIITSLSSKFEKNKTHDNILLIMFENEQTMLNKNSFSQMRKMRKNKKKRLMNVTWMRRYLLIKQRILRLFILINFAINEIN
jgi:hypothetical protein